MEHLKKYAILYLFLALVVGIVLGTLPWSKWFAKNEGEDCKTSDGKDGKKDATGNCVATIGERRGTVNLNDTGDLLRKVESKLRTSGASQSIIDSRITALKQKLSKNPSTPQRYSDYLDCVLSCQGWCGDYSYGQCLDLL